MSKNEGVKKILNSLNENINENELGENKRYLEDIQREVINVDLEEIENLYKEAEDKVLETIRNLEELTDEIEMNIIQMKDKYSQDNETVNKLEEMENVINNFRDDIVKNLQNLMEGASYNNILGEIRRIAELGLDELEIFLINLKEDF